MRSLCLGAMYDESLTHISSGTLIKSQVIHITETVYESRDKNVLSHSSNWAYHNFDFLESTYYIMFKRNLVVVCTMYAGICKSTLHEKKKFGISIVEVQQCFWWLVLVELAM